MRLYLLGCLKKFVAATAKNSALMSAIVVGLITSGCGQNATPNANSDENASFQTAELNAGVQTQSQRDAQTNTANVAGTSPESLMEQVARLSARKLQSESDAYVTPASAQAIASADKSRHREIAQLSMEVITQTHADPAKAQIFNNAVHYLSDAQVRLALEGDIDAERKLLENADMLLKRDSASLAAIEANAKVVELAHLKAEQIESEDFATTYCNQARMFATNFSHEPNRAAVTLLDAARWCDRRGFSTLATTCYTDLRTSFASTLFAEQADGPLRRLSMLGQPLIEFTGPTIDGGIVERSQYNGQPMVVVFWDSQDPDLLGTFNDLEQIRRSRSDVDVALIGVCLDEDANAARSAIASLPRCPQVYSPIPDEQGRNNPLARYYGVQDTPTIWMISSDGTVVSLDALPADLNGLR